jgi:hypothetical protein
MFPSNVIMSDFSRGVIETIRVLSIDLFIGSKISKHFLCYEFY